MSAQPGSSQQHQLFLDNNVQSFDLMTKQFQDVNIDVYGTFEEPLFNANQIGKLLGIQKIKDSIKIFDSDMKVLKGANTIGGLQQQWFLTEKGLYEVLFMSRKSIAKQFKNWVFEILKEIRTTGQYKQKQQYEQREQQLIEENERYKKEREDYAITFEEEQYEKYLYIFRQGNEEKNIYYVGQQEGVQARLEGDSSGNGLKEIHKIPCIDDNLCENIIRSILQRQGCHHKKDDLSTCYFYRCNLRYILLLSKHVCNTINILYQCRQQIQEDELIQILQEEFSVEHTIKQDDSSQFLTVQDTQQQINSNKEQERTCDLTDEFETWIQKHLKNKKSRYVICDSIRERYMQEKKKYIGKISFNKQVDDYIKNNLQKYPDVVFKRIDIKLENGGRIRGKGFENCSYTP